MHRYTIFFITVNALRVPGNFSAHHWELKNCTHSIGYMSSLLGATTWVGEFQSLLAATASMGELELTHASGSSKQAWHVPVAVCTVSVLPVMGGETA